MKKFLQDIKKRLKKTSTHARDLVPHSDLSAKLHMSKRFPKTSTDITGTLKLSADEALTITQIHYLIVEDIDPIIGKDKNEAEQLWEKTTKKKIPLDATTPQQLDFKIPILFANEHKEEKIGGDYQLLNHMSERSRKTAINYDLICEISYILDTSKEKNTHTVKHGVNFE